MNSLLDSLKVDDIDTSILDTITDVEKDVLASILLLYREHQKSTLEIIGAGTSPISTGRQNAVIDGVGLRAIVLPNLLELVKLGVDIHPVDDTYKKDIYVIDSLSFNLYDFSGFDDFHVVPKTHFPRPNKHLNIKKPSQMKNNKINVRQSVNRGK